MRVWLAVFAVVFAANVWIAAKNREMDRALERQAAGRIAESQADITARDRDIVQLRAQLEHLKALLFKKADEYDTLERDAAKHALEIHGCTRRPH